MSLEFTHQICEVEPVGICCSNPGIQSEEEREMITDASTISGGYFCIDFSLDCKYIEC